MKITKKPPMLLLVMFLFGCVSKLTPLLPGTATPYHESQMFITPTLIRVSTSPNTEYRATPTHRKTATPWPTDISTNLATLLPTYLPEDQQKQLTTIIEGDTICRLPCYGGITPGISSKEDAYRVFAPISRGVGGLGTDALWFFVQIPTIYDPRSTEKPIIFRINLDQTIYMIEAIRYNYAIQTMLSVYGQPDEVYFRIVDHALEDNPAWNEGMSIENLALYYGNQGILAMFYIISDRNAEHIQICPGRLIDYEAQPWIHLWSPQEPLTFSYLVDQIGDELTQYIPIHAATNGEMDINLFFDTFKLENNMEKCFWINHP